MVLVSAPDDLATTISFKSGTGRVVVSDAPSVMSASARDSGFSWFRLNQEILVF